MTKTFEEVISGIRKAKKGVEVREDLAQMGEYCKQFTEEAGTRADAAKAAAETAATNAKASEKKATDAVAGIEQTKTDAVQAVQNAQTTATTAVQQAQRTATTAVTTKQTEAVQAVGTAQTGAVQAVDDERDAALQQVADSTKAAQTAASSAAASEQAAGNAATAAGGYASNAKSSATAASGSASAAAASESNAASSAQSAGDDADRAEAAAGKAEAIVNADKTLTVSGAPADAAAVGTALDKKANKDVILDEDGNVIFYSKAAVDKLLAGKLGLHDTADNSAKWNNYERRFNETTGSTLVLVETEGKYIDLRPADSIGLTAIVASGSNYVRFGDGTQICWGLARDGVIPHNATFPVPFTSEPSITAVRHWGGPTGAGDIEVWVYDTINNFTGFKIGSNQGIYANWIAIGRWK